jgi:hypothetical protein
MSDSSSLAGSEFTADDGLAVMQDTQSDIIFEDAMTSDTAMDEVSTSHAPCLPSRALRGAESCMLQLGSRQRSEQHAARLRSLLGSFPDLVGIHQLA